MSHLILPAISDMHLHLRQGDLLPKVCPHTATRCHRVLVMPNTNPPIATGEEAVKYKEIIKKQMPNVDVLTTIKFLSSTTPKMIKEAAALGVAAVKLYPHGVTTNSDDGIGADVLNSPVGEFLDCIEMIKKTGMTLCLHGEMPGVETKDSEAEFLEFVDFLAYNFPKLRVVLEHISTAQQVAKVRKLASKSKLNIVATITLHHLDLTHDMVVGDKVRPHNFCKPIAKWASDREELRKAAMSGDPCFFLGSDSAPHEVCRKECPEGCAGVYSAPILGEGLIEIFDKYDALDKLPNFMSGFGNKFYIGKSKEKIPTRRYEKKKTSVPGASGMGDVQPYRAWEELEWILSE